VADALQFSLGPYLVEVAVDFGPRVLSFRREPGPDLFAQLGPDLVIDHPDSGLYRFRGGHRLWASPEIPAITYAPDDQPCEVTEQGDTLIVVGPPDRAGLKKRLSITSRGEEALVEHVLTNAGLEPIEIAPWAITQLRLDGTAIVPIDGSADPNRLQANASLVLWPYTDLTDPRVTIHPGALTVRAEAGAAFKIGTGPDPGRLGYLLAGHLFTKTVTPADDGRYADRGAVGQFYLGDSFCELETVGPLVTLVSEEETAHREIWSIEECADLGEALAVMTEDHG
jgi:hypothetical protein